MSRFLVVYHLPPKAGHILPGAGGHLARFRRTPDRPVLWPASVRVDILPGAGILSDSRLFERVDGDIIHFLKCLISRINVVLMELLSGLRVSWWSDDIVFTLNLGR